MIKIDHISFSYGEENENTGGVWDIDLNIEDGQFVVLCGESGCGKTTVTRLINGLIPHYYEGKMTGEVWVNGAKVSEQPLYDTAAVVGSVFQNPRSQFFNVDTTSEITFGCENLGQPEKDIRERLAKTVRDFRLEKLIDRNIFHLSGGEKQKIACAGVSIMEPDVLVMDEPSSNLDAASILDLRKILAFWKSQGKTIIVSEHRLYYLRGLADRFIYLADGQVSHDYSAAEFVPIWDCARLLWSVSCLRFYRSRQRPPLRFVISTLPIKTNRKPYISWIVKFPQTELLGLLGITVPVNPHSLAVSAAWRSAVGRLSGTEENTVRKTG